MEKVILNVEGMTCGHCEAAVKKAVSSLNGVETVTVSLNTGKVSVEYDEKAVAIDEMKTAIEDQGYEIAE
ncbi:MAG TPA: copper chaperone CopZ [Massilibacterium sp.]|nr:copper chaperone CopZ [Massilibacterium sp.]